MLNFFCHHWYDLGIISAILAVTAAQRYHKRTSTTQKWLLASFLTILIHQYEEYRFPGGFPAAMNSGVHASIRPASYPLNAYNTLITNVVATYGLYLPPIFFPQVVWFGLGPIFAGFGQVMIHGVSINSKMRTFYNPGLASTLLLHVPVGLAYMHHVHSIGRLTIRELALGLAYALAIGYILIAKWAFTWSPDINTSYPFTADEMQRGGVAAYLARS